MQLTWALQENGSWFAIGKRKDDVDEKVMGKILIPTGDRKDWFWMFTDENIAGSFSDDRLIPVFKRYMEKMVVNQ